MAFALDFAFGDGFGAGFGAAAAAAGALDFCGALDFFLFFRQHITGPLIPFFAGRHCVLRRRRH